ncbi:MAG: DUF3035 domain-containing protein [Pseudomonadota bacterium]
MRAIILTVLGFVVVAACGNTDRPLRDLPAAGGGPDEFAVIPQEPLVIPDQLALPRPTPGGENRADPTPNADAIRVLGGAASAQIAGGVPSSDAALVSHASRFGTQPNIRAQLAVEDEQIRNRARRSNIFNPLGRDRYFPAYARQALDARAERARLIDQGIAVPAPSAPQPQLQTAIAPQQPEPPEEEVQPGLLQRTLDPFINQVLGRDQQTDGVRENCVFRTVPPDNRLQRVCTPVENDDE